MVNKQTFQDNAGMSLKEARITQNKINNKFTRFITNHIVHIGERCGFGQFRPNLDSYIGGKHQMRRQ